MRVTKSPKIRGERGGLICLKTTPVQAHAYLACVFHVGWLPKIISHLTNNASEVWALKKLHDLMREDLDLVLLALLLVFLLPKIDRFHQALEKK